MSCAQDTKVGPVGGSLHQGNGRLLEPSQPLELPSHYFSRDERGRFSNGLVTVVYELEDTVCNGGGFGFLAGSHRWSHPVPVGWRDSATAGVHPMVTHFVAKAGDALIFTEALQHLTLPWTVEE